VGTLRRRPAATREARTPSIRVRSRPREAAISETVIGRRRTMARMDRSMPAPERDRALFGKAATTSQVGPSALQMAFIRASPSGRAVLTAGGRTTVLRWTLSAPVASMILRSFRMWAGESLSPATSMTSSQICPLNSPAKGRKASEHPAQPEGPVRPVDLGEETGRRGVEVRDDDVGLPQVPADVLLLRRVPLVSTTIGMRVLLLMPRMNLPERAVERRLPEPEKVM